MAEEADAVGDSELHRAGAQLVGERLMLEQRRSGELQFGVTSGKRRGEGFQQRQLPLPRVQPGQHPDPQPAVPLRREGEPVKPCGAGDHSAEGIVAQELLGRLERRLRVRDHTVGARKHHLGHQPVAEPAEGLHRDLIA